MDIRLHSIFTITRATKRTKYNDFKLDILRYVCMYPNLKQRRSKILTKITATDIDAIPPIVAPAMIPTLDPRPSLAGTVPVKSGKTLQKSACFKQAWLKVTYCMRIINSHYACVCA